MKPCTSLTSAGWVAQSGSRVAFFGGSFDPPHLGHLAVARAARDAFRLDRVLFAPVGAQPLKPEGSTAGFADGVAMTRLAIAASAVLLVSLADAPKPSGGDRGCAQLHIGDAEGPARALAPEAAFIA